MLFDVFEEFKTQSPKKKPVKEFITVMNMPIKKGWLDTFGQKQDNNFNTYTTYIEKEAYPEISASNQVFFTNRCKNRNVDDCLKITFYQFIKLSRISYEKFMDWAATKIQNFKYRKDFDNCVKPVWDNIYEGKFKTWQDINSKSSRKHKLEKQHLLNFIDIAFNLYTGKELTTSKNTKFNESSINDYIEFMSQYTRTIPFVALSNLDKQNNVFIMVYDTNDNHLYNFDNYLLIPEMSTTLEIAPLAKNNQTTIKELGKPMKVTERLKTGKSKVTNKGIKTIITTNGVEFGSEAYKYNINPNFTAAICFDLFLQFTNMTIEGYEALFMGMGPSIGVTSDNCEKLFKLFKTVYDFVMFNGGSYSNDWIKQVYSYYEDDVRKYSNYEIGTALDIFLQLMICMQSGLVFDERNFNLFYKSNIACDSDQFNRYCQYMSLSMSIVPLFSIVLIDNYKRKNYLPYDPIYYSLTAYKIKDNTFEMYLPFYKSARDSPFCMQSLNNGYASIYHANLYELLPVSGSLKINKNKVSSLEDYSINNQLNDSYNELK